MRVLLNFYNSEVLINILMEETGHDSYYLSPKYHYRFGTFNIENTAPINKQSTARSVKCKQYEDWKRGKRGLKIKIPKKPVSIYASLEILYNILIKKG